MNIKQQLDTLSDYQAQVAFLEMQKQELLDTVKIPEEVLSAQAEANKQRQKIDSDFYNRSKYYDQQLVEAMAAVKDPEMPPEFVAALEAARIKRSAIENDFAAKEAEDQRAVIAAKTKIDAELQAKVQDVYTQVATRKNEINIEFTEKASGAQDNIAKLTAEIKQAVKEFGDSVKGSFLHAVYVKGRITWNTDMLDGMVVAFPALAKARKEGEPSVTLRKI